MEYQNLTHSFNNSLPLYLYDVITIYMKFMGIKTNFISFTLFGKTLCLIFWTCHS